MVHNWFNFKDMNLLLFLFLLHICLINFVRSSTLNCTNVTITDSAVNGQIRNINNRFQLTQFDRPIKNAMKPIVIQMKLAIFSIVEVVRSI